MKFLIFLISIIMISSAFADKARIAVLPIDTELKEIGEKQIEFNGDLVRSVFLKEIPQELIELILKENINILLKDNMEECLGTEGKCEVEIGRSMAASYLIKTKLMKFNESYKISMLLFRTDNGNLLN